jgi:hypothetical protein
VINGEVAEWLGNFKKMKTFFLNLKNNKMKNLILIIFFIFLANMSYSQEKWYHSAEIDLISPNKKEYFYNDSNNKIIDVNLETEGLLLNSFGIQYSYNYLLFSKMSIGIVGGFQNQSKPDYTMVKLGGVIRYFFVDKNDVYVYLQNANNFTLNKDKFKSGNNLRLGLGFPFLKREKFNINGNLFFEQNYFKLDKTNPILNLSSEKPRSLTVKSFGISIGIKF